MNHLPLVIASGSQRAQDNEKPAVYKVNMWMSLSTRLQPPCNDLMSEYMLQIVITHVMNHFGDGCRVVLAQINEEQTTAANNIVNGVQVTYITTVATPLAMEKDCNTSLDPDGLV